LVKLIAVWEVRSLVGDVGSMIAFGDVRGAIAFGMWGSAIAVLGGVGERSLLGMWECDRF